MVFAVASLSVLVYLYISNTTQINKKVSFIYLGYGKLFGPTQFGVSDNASPDTYFKLAPSLHFDVSYPGHKDCDALAACV